MELHERTFAAGVVTLNYVEAPSPAPPLLLLHGGSARWQSFESILPDLAKGWHVYAPDFRGHGKSGWVRGTYRLQDYAEDTIAFLRDRVRAPACVFGHSLGGIVALMVAAQYPEGCRAVAVGDSPLSSATWHAVLLQQDDRLRAWRDLAGGQVPYDRLVEAVKAAPIEVPDRPAPVPMREVMGEDAPVYTWLATNLYQIDPDTQAALFERFDQIAAGYAPYTLLPQIRCPVLLLQADPTLGGLMTNEEVDQALQLLPDPHHVQLAGVDHALHHIHPAPVAAALQSFFSSY